MEYVFDWKKPATYAAAISLLAADLKEYTGDVLGKSDREALARIMITHSRGELTGGYGKISWNRNGAGDVVYSFSKL